MLGGMTTPAPTPRAPAQPMTFRELLKLWPDLSAAASALEQPHKRVDKWYRRNLIRPRYWPAVIAGVRACHGIDLSADDLLRMTLRGEAQQEVAA